MVTVEENRRNYFLWNKDAFENAVRQRVCADCDYHRGNGSCGNLDPRGCAIFREMPRLISIAQRLPIPAALIYRQRVKESVPLTCQNETIEEPCPYQDTLECGLDALLPLVLDAVREEDAVLEKRSGF